METANDERNPNSKSGARAKGLYPLIIPDVVPSAEQQKLQKPSRIKFLSKFASKDLKTIENNEVTNDYVSLEKHHFRGRSVSEDRNRRPCDWVCPNDRQLTLRSKLHAGWSDRAERYEKYGTKPEPLTNEEHETITSVIKRAEEMDKQEQERIGFLVDRLNNMKRHALGSGNKHCVLCGEKLGFLGSSYTICFNCQETVCTQCCKETVVTRQREPVLFCRICAETRDMLMKSNAWFYKGMPPYVLPEKPNRFPHSYRMSEPLRNKIFDFRKEEDGSSSEDEIRTTVSGPARYTLSGSSNKSSFASHGSTKNIFGGSGSSSLSQKAPKVVSSESNNISNENFYLRKEYKRNVTSNISFSGGGRSRNHEPLFRKDGSFESSESGGSVPQILVNHCDGESLNNRDISELDRSLMSSNHHTYDEYADEDLRSTLQSGSSLGTIELSIQFDTTDPCASSLHVSLHRAKGLKGMDINGLSDPFCRLVLLRNNGVKPYRLKTKTIPKTVNPEFNETITFYGITNADMNQFLYILVLDNDKYGRDFLGEAKFLLKRLKPGVTRDLCLNLEKHIPENSSDEILEEDLGSNGQIALTLSYSTRKRSLIVGIMYCLNLIPMDSNGLSDPFVKLYLKSPEGTQLGKSKTSIRWKNLNPIFNEDFPFETKITDLSRKSLVITVWDKDPGYRNNDFLGSLELGCHSKGDRLRQWIDMIKYPDHKHEGIHNLSGDRIKD